MISAPLPDAGSNWVDRHAPEALKPWLKLGRFDRPVGIWLLLIPGWQGIALALAQFRKLPDAYDAWLFIGFAIGACLMRAAGCAFNDIVDRKIDRQVARTADRPIASGRISVKKAMAFVIGCSLVSLLILLTLNWTAVFLGVLSLALVAAYPFMKRITWWPQAWLGLTFNWGALMGFAAAASGAALVANGMVAAPSGPLLPMVGQAVGDYSLHDTYYVSPSLSLFLPALLLYLGGVFWTLGYDTVYALQDIEDDAMVGVKSSARRLGPNVRNGVAGFYLISLVFAAAAGLTAGLGPLFWVGMAAYALHFRWQFRRLKPDDGALALRLFKSNRDAGLILLLAIILGSLQLPL
ncbi:UbiA family prenyltransferase [Brevundimonas sp. Root1279]|uniref:UbiA family prenyltransferase n=1 Tax=Brevundimonas sp. Root1279 TaxID=1736443 RepID=UPI0006F462F9|nr:UbiA family prenyltransferase [Brevundimonas sp. Root1279]KQW82937.1 4-hydroxybenzoate octaprenyltransferase [Brevundimonas sp. Root1279]